MPVGFYIVPYKRRSGGGLPVRYCAIDDYTAQIFGAGGNWSEVEILGNRAIVKLRASAAILTQADGIFKRIPKDRLDDSLSDLPTGVKQALKNEILDQGYTLQEVQDRFPNDLGTYTLRQVLKFMATRRLKPRYDRPSDEIVLDGAAQLCKDVDLLDTEVVED